MAAAGGCRFLRRRGASRFWGTYRFLGSLPHRKLRSMAEAHGPVMLLWFGRVPTVVASSAGAAQEAMKAREAAFANRARARRVSVLHLLSPRRIASFRGVREQEVAALLDRVRRRCGVRGGGETVNLSDMLMSYANGVISRAAFGDGAYGLDGDEGGGKLRELFANFEALLGTATVGEFVPWLAWVDKLMGLDAKAARISAELDGLLERVIADHRERRRLSQPDGGDGDGDGDENVDHRDFVDVLLDVSEVEEGAGAGEVLLFDAVAIKAIILLTSISISEKMGLDDAV
ncbi:hypothetical protein OsI_00980 [Oryza sativa Indica Group]|uniref:Uncharacterized protein n=1 Tax=Oryza sativa subsp. indica TaxID=39946 RepID=B8AAZ0_ORYSI|nr:hypothetical protein OsI_00980 [Oryza sativa Indica Group]